MTAMLGMYDMPAIQDVNDRFWSLIRTELGTGPDRLDRDRDVWEIWQDPALVLAQTCGMPFRTRLHQTVQLVGTPDYGLPGCPPGHYCSVFVARAGDDRDLAALAEGVFAYNEALSQSGWAAPVSHLLALGLHPGHPQQSGAHALSARAVVDGSADLAALDALTWELLCEHTDLGPRLREVAHTAPTPTLPYITAPGRDAPAIARAVRAAIANLAPADRAALHLRGLVDIPAAAYLAVPNPPAPDAFRPQD
ncbi:phosphate/phosphite/phosphonate ABC transporter substrate-binding protein [Ruegeria sp. WL0004]|uniref:Phosphate/phosphite/phosphonate ABC transporter substrate-binding protein n=1 Tax=Ruegeria marisflavi TaxID=2984152 RepID=A0ABT2WPI1_9RHOB|nr:phosphate/phosphite/phosphonate ABC transporter substrate-binding protein [Ruegeria sp. WL0004]MCU9837816.1 phosphate/phosphite/phosphonate ABC transporter substrate-binding protein [Ruegeria sp. WL0004]